MYLNFENFNRPSKNLFQKRNKTNSFLIMYLLLVIKQTKNN